ncbi:lysophospholipid acyltransferase family protein [Clostridium intestinale]|jgi:1-acyl-sn-glycerol-3-phosphate acyltransferase|uniref:1-acyl-sn-glycerol-3-phosphate acyltransferase n=2 Tax=Clostridium intestinale TaxID=36845 RepID=U2MZ48_9CLOT|nr:lysophospholipid acyltransferase family protein [Clostridium intestinale]ERK28517.1 1-acyl-sn-glycerol-3-phosphate acyltransferase [Clostridium intestinale URNW]QLY79791.1 1-acyl-sn-glycerol-3-phosphate acyltransferase [Clostridium intestinale]
MLRTIAWYTHFAVSLLLKTPEMFMVKKMIKDGKNPEAIEYIEKTTRKWALSQMKLSGARVKIYGEENIPKDVPVLFIGNHQSNFDIALFLSYIKKPKGYIAKSEMKSWPLVHTWMEFIDCVFMDRSNIRKSAEAIVQGVNILKSGHSLVIFPEGTRSKGDKLGDFKAGSFKLATKAKVAIVPVTISGSYKLMEQNGNKIKPADVELYIHPMVETKDLSKEELDGLPKKVKNIIGSKLPNIS